MLKPKYEINGLEFTLKPTTVRNRQKLEEFTRAQEQKTDEDLKREDEYLPLFEAFILVTDGPHDKLKFEDFDIKVAEVAIQDFLPNSRKIAMALAGY